MNDVRYQLEDMILELADIVKENRYLRTENKRLKEIEKEYNQSIFNRAHESEEASRNMLKAALVGTINGKEDKELVKDLIEYL